MNLQSSSYDADSPEAPTVLAWQKEVAKSIAQSTPSEPRSTHTQNVPAVSTPPQVIVNNQYITTPAPPVVVTRVRADEAKASDEISTRTFVGTVIGAAAGGLIMYAMSKVDERSNQQPEAQKIVTYRTIEAPPALGYVSSNKPPEHEIYSKRGSVANDSGTVQMDALPSARGETVVPRSEYSRIERKAEGDLVVLTDRSRVLATEPKRSNTSQISTSQRTARQSDTVLRQPSAPTTDVKSARDIPLPYSVATSRASRDPVLPADSISQVSTKRSKASRKPKHYLEDDEHRDGRESKAGSKKGSGKASGFKVMGERGSIPGF